MLHKITAYVFVLWATIMAWLMAYPDWWEEAKEIEITKTALID